MEIWLDTSNVDLVAHGRKLGIIHGVTTNPTILSLSKLPPQELIAELLEAQNGLVAVQVLSDDLKEMIAQAKNLSAFSSRIIVKIPATQDGIRAIHALSQEGVPTLATAIFEPRQALLAFKAGAHYLAAYLGRIADTGKNPMQVMSEIMAMKLNYGFGGKIMGAGIRELKIAMACVEMGLCAVTLSDKIFNELIEDSVPTLNALDKFAHDWSRSVHSTGSFTMKEDPLPSSLST